MAKVGGSDGNLGKCNLNIPLYSILIVFVCNEYAIVFFYNSFNNPITSIFFSLITWVYMSSVVAISE